MNSYKKLLNNVIIFTFGTLGSRLISFLLVPLYTYYLSRGEYGTVDLVMTTVSMLIPVVSLTMHEAVIRFVMNRLYDKTKVIINALAISILGYIILLLFYPFLKFFNVMTGSLEYLYILLLVQMINQIFAQYTRGIGESKKFAFNGILTTFFTGSLNVLFLVILDWGVTGYFLAYISAYIISTIYLLIVAKPLRNAHLNNLNKEISLTFLKYSIPLIPNSLMWWLINSSSRYFISWFVGIEANGIFAVSSKIPALINIISQVFSQAWQLSAFEEYEKSNDTSFYSNVFDFYMSILLLATSTIILILKPTFSFLFADEYFNAWHPVPFLILGSVFSAASGFIGVAYTASKKTEGVFKTSIYGGIISVTLNLFFIPTLGIVGAGISSMISFFSMFVIRYFDTKELLSLKINWKKLILTLSLIFLQILVLFMKVDFYIELSVIGIVFMLILIVNRSVFQAGIAMLTSILKRK